MSKLNLVYKGEIKDGKLKFNLQELQKSIALLGEGAVELVLRSPRKPKSDQQHRYYFGVIVKIISEWTGYDTIETHELLKAMFLPYGHKSSMTLSTVEVEEMNTNIRQYFLINHEVMIPLPNEIDYDNS
jgi:hypothetical protein